MLFCTTVFAGKMAPANTEYERHFFFESGILVSNDAPLSVKLGARYNSLVFQLEGFYLEEAKNKSWLKSRVYFLYRFFENLPFHFSPGISAGYLYAKNENERNKSFNTANQIHFLNEYNEKEYLDFSLAFQVQIYFLQTTVFLPVCVIQNNETPSLLWNIGFSYEF